MNAMRVGVLGSGVVGKVLAAGFAGRVHEEDGAFVLAGDQISQHADHRSHPDPRADEERRQPAPRPQPTALQLLRWSLILMGISLLVAALSYLVMSLDVVEHMVFIFPELLLVLLAATLLLGRYRGFRLLELRRFRALSGD